MVFYWISRPKRQGNQLFGYSRFLGSRFPVIDVLLLGTGAMMPLPHRYLSATLFRVGSHMHLIDCGEGTQVAMREHGWGFKRLESILITHFHSDHIAGIPGLMHTLSHSGKTEPLNIIGPAGLYGVIEGLFVIVGQLPFEVYIHEVKQDDELELAGGVHVSIAEGEHRGPVLTYRFDLDRSPAFLPDRAEALGVPRLMWTQLQQGENVEIDGRVVHAEDVRSGPRTGISFGLATDTRPVEPVRRLMQGVDLLITEGTYGDDEDATKAAERGHMTFREAATLARDADAGALWLTHFGVGLTSPGEYLANATSMFPATIIGESGLTGTISFGGGYTRSGIR